jgi:protocatechuate 3,4-dioxygenase beta subunit
VVGEDLIPPAQKLSDKEGMASIRLPPGKHRVAVVSKEPLFSRSDVNKDIAVTVGSYERLEVSLSPAKRLFGKVVDAAGRPVGGARVIAGTTTGSGTTDANGRFGFTWDLCNVGDTRPLVLEARHRERSLHGIQEVADGNQEVTIKVSPAARVFGYVTDPNGRPLAGALVWHWGHGYRTDSNGRYEIGAVPPGLVGVDVEANDHGRANGKMQLDAVPAEPRRMPDVVLEPANLSVAGVVKDLDGMPVADATVWVQGDGQPNYPHAKTDKQGRFRVNGLCKGPIGLGVRYRPRDLQFFGPVKQGDMDLKVTVVEKPRVVPP